jgi:hypothetical protein
MSSHSFAVTVTAIRKAACMMDGCALSLSPHDPYPCRRIVPFAALSLSPRLTVPVAATFLGDSRQREVMGSTDP